ncbi:MAG TPA: ion channel [Myxococcales bacterium]|jgi:voltage-gated potassium channel|nr:ion channel [Myxococcales bacterium]
MTRSEELTQFVCTAAALFYCAEEQENPAVKTYFDALHYISTSLSVGYANFFPVTQAGKAIGAVVQMVGPAMSSKALDQPETGASLDDVLAELKKITAALPAAR